MDKLARKQQEQERIVRLANAMHEAGARIAQGFQQLMEASGAESRHEQVRMRARHIIEEGRLNYDQAVQELRRLEDEKRNDRLEPIFWGRVRADLFRGDGNPSEDVSEFHPLSAPVRPETHLQAEVGGTD
jgi:hypothetical protein